MFENALQDLEEQLHCVLKWTARMPECEQLKKEVWARSDACSTGRVCSWLKVGQVAPCNTRIKAGTEGSMDRVKSQWSCSAGSAVPGQKLVRVHLQHAK